MESPIKKTMTFFAALEQVSIGKHITRIEWENPETYGLLLNGILCIHMNGEDFAWKVSDGDMLNDDWIIL